MLFQHALIYKFVIPLQGVIDCGINRFLLQGFFVIQKVFIRPSRANLVGIDNAALRVLTTPYDLYHIEVR
jgi:hypothetical protein